MKARWRQHEFILVSVLAVIAVTHGIIRLFLMPVPFTDIFSRYKGFIWLQVITIAIQYGCYIWLNKQIVEKVNWYGNQPWVTKILQYIWTRLQMLVIVYLLGPVTNFATYYLSSQLPNKSMANMIHGILPPHPQPFLNTFGGFGIALFFTLIYLVYASLREATIRYIERPDGRQAFRIMVANQATLLALGYFSVQPFLLMFSSPILPVAIGQSTAVMYFMIIPAIITVCLVNIYWLFPLQEEGAFFRAANIRRLLVITAMGALPVIFLQRAQIEGQLIFFIGGWIFQLLIVTPVSWTIYRQLKDKIGQLRRMEAALTRSEADIRFLHSQINPHFLFNTLNTLYGTALEEGSRRTAQGIQMLGDMMRFMLHESYQEEMPIGKEIAYLHNYIALQKLRIQSSPNIQIEVKLPAGCSGSIAPMLLIPLVENAFKHGISLVQPSWIKIDLVCTEYNIRFTVNNSLQPVQENNDEHNRSGIGLQNVAERLNLLYPGRHRFSATAHEKEFIAQLSLEL